RLEAIRIAADTSDASIITSALVLFSATLGVSFVTRIGLISTICLMLARGALISALISLFFLPALLCLFEPVFNVTSLHWRTVPGQKEETIPEMEAVLAAGTLPDAETGLEAVPAEEPVTETEMFPDEELIPRADGFLAAEVLPEAEEPAPVPM
ncbi:MAG: MMPL family transporter, partial [Oscillibacter sp.]|nr:MMPL family transporter [Oscillibacter sp.]